MILSSLIPFDLSDQARPPRRTSSCAERTFRQLENMVYGVFLVQVVESGLVVALR